jgi:riboflavin biosynthesis pyrimidine reductase
MELPLNLPKTETAEQISDIIKKMYNSDLTNKLRLLHVTAVYEQSPGNYNTLKINQDTPKSDYDFFTLNLARARADAIISTGQILREESVTHELQGPASIGLAIWRKDILKKVDIPYSLLITSGDRGINLGHPILNKDSGTKPLIYTKTESYRRLKPINKEFSHITFIPVEETSLQDALKYLWNHLNVSTISIEAGPSTSQELYRPINLIDELMLSIYHRPVKDSVIGKPFQTQKTLDANFKQTSSFKAGDWEFRRYIRK